MSGIFIVDRPIVEFGSEADKTFLLGSHATLKCDAIAYPLPSIKWIFISENGEEESYLVMCY